MRYTLIIPAWNEAAYISATLASVAIAMQHCTHQGDVVVVNNNSTDDTAEIAAVAGATVVFEPVNQIARARNAGAHSANTEALVFLDADTTVTTELLQIGLDALESGEVVAGGVLVALDYMPTRTVGIMLKLWNRLAKRFSLAAGCFIFCRRDAFEAIGGFDTKVYAAEEILLVRRLKRWGKRQGMRFHLITHTGIVTSSRKAQWYSARQLTIQLLIFLIPGAMYSKRLCKTWYDDSTAREK